MVNYVKNKQYCPPFIHERTTVKLPAENGNMFKTVLSAHIQTTVRALMKIR